MRVAQGPAAAGLRQDGVLAFQRRDQARALLIAEQSVMALHALNAGAQPTSFAHMRRYLGADLIISPIAAAVQHQPTSFVLNQPIGLGIKVHENHLASCRVETVYPSPLPHQAAQLAVPTSEVTRMRALQAHIWRAVPSQPVEIDDAARASRPADLQPDLGDGIALEIRRLPFQLSDIARGHAFTGAFQEVEPVFAVVVLDVERDIDGAVIPAVSQNAGADGLTGGERRAGHQAIAGTLKLGVDLGRWHKGGGFDAAHAPKRQARIC